jgi:hypothetical protein
METIVLLIAGVIFICVITYIIITYKTSHSSFCKKGYHDEVKEYGHIPPATDRACDVFYSHGLIRRYCKHCGKDL